MCLLQHLHTKFLWKLQRKEWFSGRKFFRMTYWILFLPAYQYSAGILQQLCNYTIFHWAERLKLLHYMHGGEKRLTVRYFSSSKEQYLQCTSPKLWETLNFLFFSTTQEQVLSAATAEFSKGLKVGEGKTTFGSWNNTEWCLNFICERKIQTDICNLSTQWQKALFSL